MVREGGGDYICKREGRVRVGGTDLIYRYVLNKTNMIRFIYSDLVPLKANKS